MLLKIKKKIKINFLFQGSLLWWLPLLQDFPKSSGFSVSPKFYPPMSQASKGPLSALPIPPGLESALRQKARNLQILFLAVLL